jgi:hypothetical protein
VSPALVNQINTRMKQTGELDGGTPKGLTADDLVEAKKLADELGVSTRPARH